MEKSKEETHTRIVFLINNINMYKNKYKNYPKDLSYLNDINNDNFSWCSKNSSKKIDGKGLCYYTMSNDHFILEVVGDYNDWFYDSKEKN